MIFSYSLKLHRQRHPLEIFGSPRYGIVLARRGLLSQALDCIRQAINGCDQTRSTSRHGKYDPFMPDNGKAAAIGPQIAAGLKRKAPAWSLVEALTAGYVRGSI